MREKIIISIISKVYFIITSLLFFIFFSFSVLFIVLQNGLYIDSISLPNVKVKQLYIKWNENLDVSMKELHISDSPYHHNSSLEFNIISQYIKRLPELYSIFEKIYIEKITFNEFSSSFKYEKDNDGFFLLSSPDFNLESSLSFVSSSLHIKIKKLSDSHRDIKISGTLILNPILQNITASLIVDIHNQVSLSLLAFVNKEKLYYKIKSLNKIKNIDYIMEQLNLNKYLQYWAYKAIDFSSLRINNVFGLIDFNDLNSSYKNMTAYATGYNLKYCYNKKLDRIHTKRTDLKFQNGVLYIYPRQAKTYKSKLGKSWIKIDFTQPQELLTIKLLFDGKLDKDTLKILKSFKIQVPFLQNTGKTKVDLTLQINLRTLHVNAKGVFFTPLANFKYANYDINIFNAKVKLNNYNLLIKNMLINYQDIMNTKVNVSYDAKTAKGKLDFNISKLDLNSVKLKLLPSKKHLNATYFIAPKKNSLYIDKSHWSFKKHNLEIDPMNVLINLKESILTILKTKVLSKELGEAYVKGEVNFKKITADLNINIKEVYFGEIKLSKEDNNVSLHYNKDLTISSENTTHFELNSEVSFLNPFTIVLKDNTITLGHTYLNIGNLLKTKLHAYYDLDKKLGYLQTRRTRFSTHEFGLLYFNQGSIKHEIKTDNDMTTTIESKDLEIKLTNTREMWNIDFNSIKLLSQHSLFLKNYLLTNGSINLHKMKDKKDIEITANIKYPHAFMLKNDIPIHEYYLKGNFNTKTNALDATLNNILDIKIKDRIDITMNNIGININAILDIANSVKHEDKGSNNLLLTLQAKDSYLYISDNRRILSEQISLYYENQILSVGLLYKEGVAGLKYEKNEFYAYGQNFNDDFMDKLFALSDFDGGEFEFNLGGTTKKYEGIFTINDSTILDYKVLNNILAFVNTIPSLATFSTPGYNAKGIYLEKAYMKFLAKDNTFDISDIYFHSKELDILGKGTASFQTNTIDIALKLRTDIGSSLAKIPIVGYLILDGDSLSTTLSVTGALDNPDINTLIGEEIIIAPLKILFRTLMLPEYFLNSIRTNDE